jgi:hypothetical protein
MLKVKGRKGCEEDYLKRIKTKAIQGGKKVVKEKEQTNRVDDLFLSQFCVTRLRRETTELITKEV